MKDFEFEINQRYQKIFVLKDYLTSTDYQRIRELDGGDPMKEEVRLKRAEARSLINKLEDEIASLEYEKEKADAASEAGMLVD